MRRGVAVLAGVVASGCLAVPATASFVPARGFSLPSSTNHVVVTDLVAGGPAEVVAVNRDGAVIAREVRPGGLLGPPTHAQFRGLPHTVVAADIDGDGDGDLVAGTGAGTVEVLRGGPDGPRQPEQLADGLHDSVRSVAVGDLDGDAVPDVVAAASEGVYVITGAHGTVHRIGEPTARVAVGEVTGDDRDDVIAAGSGVMTVYRRTGPLAFSPHARSAMPRIAELALADIDGDGLDDALLFGGNRVEPWMQLFRGTGNGLAEGEDVAEPARIEAIAVAPRPGRPAEVVAAGWHAAITYAWREGRLEPEEVSPFPTSARPGSMVLADATGDGELDLLAAERRLYLLERSDARATAAPPAGPPVREPLLTHQRLETPTHPSDWDHGDVTGDGIADLVVGIDSFGEHQPARVLVFRGTGDAEFAPDPLTLGTLDAIRVPVAVADVDGDGDADVLAGDRNGVHVWHQEGGALLGPVVLRDDLREVSSLDAADLFGDAAPELLVRSYPDGSAILGPGPHGQVDLLPPHVYFGRKGDPDGDGLPDLVSTQEGRLSWHRQAAPGVFDHRFQYTDLAAPFKIWGDWDGDGLEDGFALRLADDGNLWLDRHLSASGRGPSPVPHSTPLPVRDDDYLRIGDVDGDGRADLVVISDARARVRFAFQQSDGEPGPLTPVDFPLEVDRASGTFDLDGDGRAEMIYVSGGTRAIAVARFAGWREIHQAPGERDAADQDDTGEQPGPPGAPQDPATPAPTENHDEGKPETSPARVERPSVSRRQRARAVLRRGLRVRCAGASRCRVAIRRVGRRHRVVRNVDTGVQRVRLGRQLARHVRRRATRGRPTRLEVRLTAADRALVKKVRLRPERTRR